MKKKTVTHYEASDGKTFLDEADAKGHEISLLLDKLNGGEMRLTGSQTIRVMASNAEAFAKLFADLAKA